jgi:hypothetical protein
MGGGAQPFSGGQMLMLRIMLDNTGGGAGFTSINVGEVQANWT